MTTEQYESETDNEIPPVARLFGRAVSEWVTYSFIALSILAVIFGSKVGSERDAQAERAMATLGALADAAESQVAAGRVLICDETLLDPELLANDYLKLSIRPAPIDEDNKSLGYGPALFVSVVEKEVSGDTWDTAKRLMDLVKEAGNKAAEPGRSPPERAVTADDNPGQGEVATVEGTQKPKNRLRETRQRGYGETEEYLRYSILASEVALCSQGA